MARGASSAALLLLLVAVVVIALGGRQAASEEASTDSRPNVIAIVTDDQNKRLFTRRLMPNTKGLLDSNGVRLRQLIITSPLCCPSRATHLTGQYGHSNGVLANKPGYRGLAEPGNVLPSWLQSAGYRTAHVGRFLNGYKRVADRPAEPAPGWDRWIGLMNMHYRDFNLSVDGERHHVGGEARRSYVTRVLHRWVNRLIRSFAADPEPFYLQIDELAPHSDHEARGICNRSALPGPQLLKPVRSLKLKAEVPLERNLSDKPAYIRRLPPLNARERDAVQQRLRCRAAALREVDRGVGKMLRLLRRLGEFDNTAIVFYSDNGYFSGEHGLVRSKGLPYEEAVTVPALFRIPPESIAGATLPRYLDLPAANIDIAPTILDLAGAQPCIAPDRCRTLDGRSLLPGLADPTSWPPQREILVELDQGNQAAGGTLACAWSAVRRGQQVYVEYERVVKRSSRRCRRTDEVEHYRLRNDPGQRRNLWPPREERDIVAQRELAVELERLRGCSGSVAATTAGDGSNPCP